MRAKQLCSLFRPDCFVALPFFPQKIYTADLYWIDKKVKPCACMFVI